MKSKKNIIRAIVIILIILISTCCVLKIVNDNNLIKTLHMQSAKIDTNNASDATFYRLVDKVSVGDYVAYDATNNYSYTSPVGSGTSHGNGSSRCTFQSSSDVKWRVLSKDTSTGEVVLISEEPIQEYYSISGAIGYLYAEYEINKACSIFGYGKGANTSKTFTYQIGDIVEGLETGTLIGSGARSINLDDINKICNVTPSTSLNSYYGKSYTHNICYPTRTTNTGYSASRVSRTDINTSYDYNISNYISGTMYDILTEDSSSRRMGYWLASRQVTSYDIGARFNVLSTRNGFIVGSELFYRYDPNLYRQ